MTATAEGSDQGFVRGGWWHRVTARPGRRSDGGMVTAELALALPALVLVTAGLLWALGLGMAQAQLVQATREGARVAARGESAASVRAAVHRSVPEAQVSVHMRADGLVSVTTAVRREPPVRVLRPLARGLSATATTAVEQP